MLNAAPFLIDAHMNPRVEIPHNSIAHFNWYISNEASHIVLERSNYNRLVFVDVILAVTL